MNLEEYLAEAAQEEFDFDLLVGGRPVAFRCRRLGRREVQRAYKAATTRKFDKHQGAMVEKLDDRALRRFLVDCVVGWRGMTYGVAAALAGKQPPNGDRAALADDPVDFSPANLNAILDEVVGLESQLWADVVRRADEREVEEAREKNG